MKGGEREGTPKAPLSPTLMMLLRRGRPPGLLSRGRGQTAGLVVGASATPRGPLAGLAGVSSPDTPRLQSPLETPPLSQRARPWPRRPPPPPPPSPAPAFRAPLAPRAGPGEVGRAPPAAPPRPHSAMGAPRPACTKPRPRVPRPRCRRRRRRLGPPRAAPPPRRLLPPPPPRPLLPRVSVASCGGGVFLFFFF
jgi:hypothetical protein